jgi:hypothetical protein
MARRPQDDTADPQGGDPHISMMATRTAGQNGVSMQWRQNRDSGSSWPDWGSPKIVPGYPNCWLRLRRVGNTFLSYYSQDGTNWTHYSIWERDTDALGDPWPESIFVGLAVTAHDRNVANFATAVFSNFEFLTPPPEILKLLPRNRSSYVSPQTNFVFTVKSLALQGINTADIKLVVNGQDKSAALTFSGTAKERDVTYAGPFQENMFYSFEITATDTEGRKTVMTHTWDTIKPDNFTIEAEDFNFDSGQFIDNVVLSSIPAPDNYLDKVGVQYVDRYGVNNDGNHEYRAFDSASGIGEWIATRAIATQELDQYFRKKYVDAQLIDPSVMDYQVGWNSVGDWWNYTRTFPAGTYKIYARLSSGNSGAFTVTMDMVVSDPTRANQEVMRLGSFLCTGTGGWDNFAFWPLKDLAGNDVILKLGGKQTLRGTFTLNGMDANFYMLVPQTGLGPLAPFVSLITPAPGATEVTPSSRIEVNIVDRDTKAQVSSVKLSMNGSELPATITPNSAGVRVVYVAPNKLPPGTNNVVLTFTDSGGQAQTNAWTFVVGGEILVKVYSDVSGTSKSDMLNADSYINNTPDQIFLASTFEYNPNQDNYAAEIIGYVIPPVTGAYTFYSSSDDASELWLSTDDNPANMQMIAYQTSWNNFRAYTSHNNPATRKSAPIQMEAGKKYFVYGWVKEGGGGDWLSVAWTVPGGPAMVDGAAPIGGPALAAIEGVVAGVAPMNPTLFKGLPLTFSAKAFASVSGVVSYQWLRNGAAIAGAVGDTYVIDSLRYPQDNGAKISVRASAGGRTTTSPASTITVIDDTTPPTIVGVVGSRTFGSVTVSFSEPVTDATANLIQNYALSGGLTISSAIREANMTNVVLLTSGQAKGTKYTLTVNNVSDYAGNVIAAGSSKTFTSYVEESGFAIAEFYGSLGGTSVPDLTSSEKYTNNMPDNVRPVYLAETPSNIADNFGWKLYGLITAPVTGDYVFHIAADDSSELWLSTDDTPANLGAGPIAYFNGWGGVRQWDPPETQGSGQQHSNPVTLTAGKKYYFMALSKEGGGGDNLAVGWTYPGLTTITVIPGQNLSAWVNPDLSAITITQQPADITVEENRKGTFSVVAAGISELGPAVSYQWQKNGVDIPGATTAAYTTPLTTLADSGTKFKVVLKVSGKTDTSAEATLTVTKDTVAPRAVAAANFAAGPIIKVLFNELMDASSIVAGNFTVSGGVTVTSATLQQNGVVANLGLSAAAADGATVTAQGVKDRAGNAATTSAVAAAGKTALFVVGNPAALNASDTGVVNLLDSKLLQVAVVDDGASLTSDAAGKALIVVSSTVSSGSVSTKFRDVAVPVINWEQACQDDFNMTLNTDGTDRGTVGGQVNLNIVNPTHPLAAGLSAGVRPVVTAAATFTWGLPNTNAIAIATLEGSPNRVGIYAYEKGATMLNAFVAPEKRIHIFLDNDTFAVLNPDGLKLVNAAVDWTIPAPVIPTVGKFDSIERVGKDVVIKWSGGGVLQSADNIKGPWTDVPGAPTSPLTVQPTDAVKFYQLRSQ